MGRSASHATATRAVGEPFELRYSRLNGTVGNEQWRQTARSDRVMVLREAPASGRSSCVQTGADSFFASMLWADECDERERALLKEPTRHVWLTHWLMPMPNPIYEEAREEMHCVSIS